MPPQTIENIPKSSLGEVISSFANEGAIKIESVKGDDDSWTVTAYFS